MRRNPTVFYETDEDIVSAFQAGDQDAFNRLVLKYKDKVFNMCYRFVFDYEEANDLAQEVFVKAYLSLKRFRGDSAFSTWLYRITLNMCKNKLKSLRYRFKHKVFTLGHANGSKSKNISMDIADGSGSPADHLERQQNEIIIQDAINKLPVEQKMVIVLRHIEGLSYEQISQITGFNLGTVKSKLSRARLNLRERLKGVF